MAPPFLLSCDRFVYLLSLCSSVTKLRLSCYFRLEAVSVDVVASLHVPYSCAGQPLLRTFSHDHLHFVLLENTEHFMIFPRYQ